MVSRKKLTQLIATVHGDGRGPDPVAMLTTPEFASACGVPSSEVRRWVESLAYTHTATEEEWPHRRLRLLAHPANGVYRDGFRYYFTPEAVHAFGVTRAQRHVRVRWTRQQDAALLSEYSREPVPTIAARLGAPETAVLYRLIVLLRRRPRA